MTETMENNRTKTDANGTAVEGELVTIETIGSLARAEIDIQIATAKRYPRSISKFKAEAKSMACLDEDTAAACLYALPRGGKTIEGGSIRFAEIVASAWGNLRIGARVIEEGERFVTSQGVCHDLERNTAIAFEARRRITDKNGKRYNDDMIVVTCNAASSIAIRNATLRVVPKAYWLPILMEAKAVAVGTQQTLVAKRAKAMDYLIKMGVTQEKVLALLDRRNVEDIDVDDLTRLRGIITAIKEETVTIEDAFAAAKTPSQEATERVKSKLNPTPSAKQEPSLQGGNPITGPAESGEPPDDKGGSAAASASSDQEAMERQDTVERLAKDIGNAKTIKDLEAVSLQTKQMGAWLGDKHYLDLTKLVNARRKDLAPPAASRTTTKPPEGY